MERLYSLRSKNSTAVTSRYFVSCDPCLVSISASLVRRALERKRRIAMQVCNSPFSSISTSRERSFCEQSPCADLEANFICLLIGSDKALLIDTGAVADPKAMRLAKAILELLPDKDHKKLPLFGRPYPQAYRSSRRRSSVRISSVCPDRAL
jgi:c-di-GMP-binding flagellar brake protein YcgR